MRKLFIFFIFAIQTISVLSQKKADIGVFLGTSSYFGDINPERLFYKPGLAIGGMYRYYLNERYALKASGIYATLSGDDPDNTFPQFQSPSFSTSLVDVGAQFEINFLEYKPGDINPMSRNEDIFSPFIFLGAGYNIILSGAEGSSNSFNLSFGTGAKLNLTDRLSCGAEWGFRKNFNDNLDGLNNFSIPEKSSFLHNNDWYSLFGLFITYKFFKFAEICPAYNN
jgi:hypothetical protein